MTEPDQKKPPTQQMKSTPPDRFYYANAFKIYASGGEIFAELGRILPTESGNVIVGETGIVMSLPTAANFVQQLQVAIQGQLVALNAQMNTLREAQKKNENTTKTE